MSNPISKLKPTRKMISYGRQEITEMDIQAVTDVLRSDFLTQGPAIAEFEKAFCDYIGCKYAVAVSNGTAALHLAVKSLGIQKGQKVITTPITFAASAKQSGSTKQPAASGSDSVLSRHAS